LAAAGIGDQAGFELLDAVALAILNNRGDRLLILLGAEDDADKAGLRFLADEFGVLPVIDIAQRSDRRRPPGHSARLHALALVEMRDRAGVYAHRFHASTEGGRLIPGVIGKHPVGPA